MGRKPFFQLHNRKTSSHSNSSAEMSQCNARRWRKFHRTPNECKIRTVSASIRTVTLMCILSARRCQCTLQNKPRCSSASLRIGWWMEIFTGTASLQGKPTLAFCQKIFGFTFKTTRALKHNDVCFIWTTRPTFWTTWMIDYYCWKHKRCWLTKLVALMLDKTNAPSSWIGSFVINIVKHWNLCIVY